MVTKATEIINLIKMIESTPSTGKKYRKVIVDGETFTDLTLVKILPDEWVFTSQEGKHVFNPQEQDIKLA